MDDYAGRVGSEASATYGSIRGAVMGYEETKLEVGRDKVDKYFNGQYAIGAIQRAVEFESMAHKERIVRMQIKSMQDMATEQMYVDFISKAISVAGVAQKKIEDKKFEVEMQKMYGTDRPAQNVNNINDRLIPYHRNRPIDFLDNPYTERRYS
jgi:hypothetical protein